MCCQSPGCCNSPPQPHNRHLFSPFCLISFQNWMRSVYIPQPSYLLTFMHFLQVFSVELVSATGGGNIGIFSVANITVPSNDGPHGVVAFSARMATTTEVGDNGTSVALLTISRRYFVTAIHTTKCSQGFGCFIQHWIFWGYSCAIQCPVS